MGTLPGQKPIAMLRHSGKNSKLLENDNDLMASVDDFSPQPATSSAANSRTFFFIIPES